MKKLFALALVIGLAVGVTACGDGGKAAADAAIKARKRRSALRRLRP